MEIKYLQDINGNKILPVTSVSAVRDANGNNVEESLTNLKNFRVSTQSSIVQLNNRIADTYTKQEVYNIISNTPETDVIVIEVPAASQSNIAGWLDSNTPSGTDPETGKSVRANKLYRVPGPDNTTYSEWAWDGTAYIMLANKDYGVDDEPINESNNLIYSKGVIKGFADFSDTLMKNDLMSKTLSHNILLANGVLSTIPAYDGYCTDDYIRVSKGEILIVNLYHTTTNPNNGWGVLWGYADKNGSSPINMLPSPNSNVCNAIVTIPDGVNYIRACSKPFPTDRKPSIIPLISFMKEKTVTNLGNDVVGTKFLLATGGEGDDENYRGFITDYIPVNVGEKYYIKGSTTYVNPPTFNGNIFAYADKSTSDVVSLGSLSERDAFAIIEIPAGYNYLRVCARQSLSDGIFVIKVTENSNVEILNSLFNAYVKSNDEALEAIRNETETKLENIDCNQISNGDVTVYKTMADLNLGQSPLVQSYDLENNVFTLYHQGAKNDSTITTDFTPLENDILHIKGHIDNIVLTGEAPGISVFIANGTAPGQCKYKKIAVLSESGDFNITVDISSLIVQEQFTETFYVWLYNDTIPTVDGSVTCTISKFKVLKYENAAGGINFSGDNAHDLFDGIDRCLSIIKRNVNDISCEQVNNGKADIYKTMSDLNLVQNPFVQSYDIASDVFTVHHQGASNASVITDSFTQSGNNLLHIKGCVDSITLTGNAPGISVFIANGTAPGQGKYKKLTVLSQEGNFDIPVDVSYLIVHEEFTGTLYVWLYNDTIPTVDGSVTCTISKFKVLEYEDAAGGINISGSNAYELFNSIDETFSNIKENVNSANNKLITPNGNKFILSALDDGTLITIPIVPNKAAFFGNSLILSFGTFGMAASEASKDYYSLITNYIRSINPSFVALPRLRGADFEFLETTDSAQVNQVITQNFLDRLVGDEDLVVIQLGDNVNNAARVTAFAQNIYTLLKAIRNKCSNARVIWMGMWYSTAEKYTIIENGCKGTGCEYILFDGLNTEDARNVIGGTARYENAQNWTVNNVVSLTENTPTNITFTFTVNGVQYTSTIDVISYSYSGTTLTYNGYYRVIQDAGVASHPSDEGMRRIANRFLYQTMISNLEETYTT